MGEGFSGSLYPADGSEVPVPGAGVRNFDVLSGERLVGKVPFAVLLLGEFEKHCALQVVVGIYVDKAHHVSRAPRERTLAEHDTSMNCVLVEYEYVAGLEVIFDLITLKQLQHGR